MSFSAVLNPTSQLIATSIGIPGPPGSDGEDGSQWFTGTGAPAPALGNPGDMYLENDGDVWQSSDASGWLVTPTNIRGPAGAAGAAGAAGPAGPQGPAGSVSSVGSHLLFTPDATYDIGASGVNRPRNLYLAGTATVGGQLFASAGTNALPSISFAGDPNTGFFSYGGDDIGVSTAGTTKWRFWGSALLAAVDNSSDIGAVAANRPRNLYLAGTATVGGAITATGDISANGVIFTNGNLYPENSGARLMLVKATSAPGNPGPNQIKLFVLAGTNANTLKLVVASQAGSTTLADNLAMT